MKVPLSWLKEYVDIAITPEELAERLLLSGTKVEEIIKEKDDIIFDLEITSNRPDCLSIIGIAREVAAILDIPLKYELPHREEHPSEDLEFEIQVTDPSLLPSYSAVVLEDIKIGESSTLIKDRLTKSGIRPINSVVDATNYVMLETGQPMHAFDYDKVAGHIFKVRVSTEGEEVTTIDKVKRKLKEGSIVIEDNEKVIDLAGLMGGENTEISETTQRTLVLFPVFDPVRIRKTSLYLNFRTEASNRLEKLLDPEGPLRALKHVVPLLEQGSNAVVASRIETKTPSPIENPTIEVRSDLINDFLGLKLELEEIEQILKKLGFETARLPLSDDPTIRVTAPSWRRDILIAEDIVEEVGRIYGYNNIPSSLPAGTPPLRSENTDYETRIKTILTGWGLNEALTYTLVSKKEIELVLEDASQSARVLDPMSVDFEYLRPTLLIGLLNSVQTNQRNGYNLNFFEIGRVFHGGFTPENLVENQPKRLSGIIHTQDFGSVKGIIETLLRALKITTPFIWDTTSYPQYIPEQGLTITYEDGDLGSMGVLQPDILTHFDIEGTWYYFNLDLDKLMSLIPSTVDYKPLPKYPSVIQDISFIAPKEAPIQSFLRTIQESGSNLLKSVELVDIYTGEKVGDKNKSVTVRLNFQSEERTLTDQEIQPLRDTIMNALTQKHAVSIR